MPYAPIPAGPIQHLLPATGIAVGFWLVLALACIVAGTVCRIVARHRRWRKP